MTTQSVDRSGTHVRGNVASISSSQPSREPHEQAGTLP